MRSPTPWLSLISHVVFFGKSETVAVMVGTALIAFFFEIPTAFYYVIVQLIHSSPQNDFMYYLTHQMKKRLKILGE